jgi:hypothetical protein
MNERLFKVLGKGRTPCHGGDGKWPRRGVWRKVDGPLVLCEHGLHLCRENDLVLWLGPEIWEAEYDGERIDAEDKIVVSKARLVRKVDTWNERTARLFACDCAERVLPIYEKRYPDDKRPRVAVETARRYAEGKATREERAAAGAAARDAAGAAARDSAWDAARDAAWAAARASAWDAARDAAWAAARAAAWDAAWAAAWAAERKWQTARLIEYLYPEGK